MRTYATAALNRPKCECCWIEYASHSHAVIRNRLNAQGPEGGWLDEIEKLLGKSSCIAQCSSSPWCYEHRVLIALLTEIRMVMLLQMKVSCACGI